MNHGEFLFTTFEPDYVGSSGYLGWQFNQKRLLDARRMIEDAKLGLRRPFQIVVATDRFCPLADVIDSLIRSTEGTGLLKAKINGRSLVRFQLLLRGKHAIEIRKRNDRAIKRLENAGVEFNYEECNSSSGISELTNARECALSFIRNMPKKDNPIVLWLDDDLAFDALVIENNQVALSRPWSFFHEIWNYHERFPEIDIGLGDVTGAPPLPASSTLLTNLKDLDAHFSGKIVRDDCQRWSEPDYYYDLSDHNRNSHPWRIIDSDLSTQSILWNLLEVGIIARPLVANRSTLEIKQDRYIRGGNTIVFNSHWLDKIDHPEIPRRGDTVWALMVENLGGTLGHFPIPLRHIRDVVTKSWKPQESKQNWLRRLEVDLIGASFQRWFANKNSQNTAEEILVERCNRQLEAFDSALEFTHAIPEAISAIIVNFIHSGIERVSDLRDNPRVFDSYHDSVKYQGLTNSEFSGTNEIGVVV